MHTIDDWCHNNTKVMDTPFVKCSEPVKVMLLTGNRILSKVVEVDPNKVKATFDHLGHMPLSG